MKLGPVNLTYDSCDVKCVIIKHLINEFYNFLMHVISHSGHHSCL